MSKRRAEAPFCRGFSRETKVSASLAKIFASDDFLLTCIFMDGLGDDAIGDLFQISLQNLTEF